MIVHILVKGREDARLKQVCRTESGQINVKLLGQEKGVRVHTLAATLEDRQPNAREFVDVEWTASDQASRPSPASTVCQLSMYGWNAAGKVSVASLQNVP